MPGRAHRSGSPPRRCQESTLPEQLRLGHPHPWRIDEQTRFRGRRAVARLRPLLDYRREQPPPPTLRTVRRLRGPEELAGDTR